MSVDVRLDLHNCVLRPWRTGDEASLVVHANNRDVWLNLRDQFPHPYTPADAQAWVQLASKQARWTSLAIEVDSEAAGGVGLTLRDDVERVSAEIGYWLGPRFWNRGIATAVVRAVTEYGFDEFSLTRIYALPFATNAASQRVLEGRLPAGRGSSKKRHQERRRARSSAVRHHGPRSGACRRRVRGAASSLSA